MYVFIELFKFGFFGIIDLDTDVDHCYAELFALKIKQDHSVIFECAPKYCILDSYVDYESYPISSKGYLPTVVDIVVIC